MTILPTGETLPEYDDQHPEGIDIAKMVQWLTVHGNWGGMSYGRSAAAVCDVLAALQAVGDATFVKNSTYRLLRRDAADVERLAAGLTRLGYAAEIVEHGGNPAAAALTVFASSKETR